MRVRTSVPFALLILGVGLIGVLNAGEPVTVLKGLDPVELSVGREVAGKVEVTRDLGHYRYRFASEENRIRFDAEPARYSVQMGGSCGRMGPLSGLGSPDRFHVHAERIYLFASDACMNRFKGAPESFLPADDPRPVASDAERKRGMELVALALKGLGGAEKVDALKGLRSRSIFRYEHEGKTHEQVTTQALGLPGDYRRETAWATGSVAAGLGAARGFRQEEGSIWRVDEQERRFILKDMLRHPVALLRARDEAGFQATAGGRGKSGETDIEWLRIWHEGTLISLGVDPVSGRILSVSWRGLTSDGYGEVSRTFSDFREVSGLTLPFASHLSRGGKPDSGGPVTLTELTADPVFDAGYFTPVE